MKGDYVFFPSDTKNKLPSSALSQAVQSFNLPLIVVVQFKRVNIYNLLWHEKQNSFSKVSFVFNGIFVLHPVFLSIQFNPEDLLSFSALSGSAVGFRVNHNTTPLKYRQ